MAEITRRDLLKGSLAVAAAAGVAIPGVLAGERLRVEDEELLLPDLDRAHDGLRVVQLSDVHVGSLTSPELVRSAVAEANRLAPDLVVLTGDYLSRHERGVGLIGEQLAGLSGPTLAVLGNHDHHVDRAGAVRELERLGYGVLQNENTTLLLRGRPFTVVGIDDLGTRHADPGRAVKGAAPGSRLYLAHDPATAAILRGFREPLLVLSGHTHGGQVNVPGLSSALLPYKAGLYRVDGVQLHVSRGLGNTWLPIRVNARPEVSSFTLRSGGPTRPARGSRRG